MLAYRVLRVIGVGPYSSVLISLYVALSVLLTATPLSLLARPLVFGLAGNALRITFDSSAVLVSIFGMGIRNRLIDQ